MLHWGDCLAILESLVPQAAGGNNLDETLRSTLVPFANNVMDEISREQRWSQSQYVTQVTTANGTQQYELPLRASDLESIRRVYYVDSTGKPHKLVGMDRHELQRVYGDVTAGGANKGEPLKYSFLQGRAISSSLTPSSNYLVLYPTPDGSGPTSGNYVINIEQYRALHPIVETIGTTAASTTLTVPSTGYLQQRNVDTANVEQDQLIIKAAGNLKTATARDWFYTAWTNAFLTGTTVAMTAQPIAVVADTPVYFYGANWLITQWPQVLIFGVLREIASYWGSEAQYQKWEVRFHDQMERMIKFDQDRLRGYDVAASAHVGANAPTLLRTETLNSIDIRGGS